MWIFCVQKDADLFSKENANSWSKRRTILKFKIWTSTGTNISMSPTSLYLYRCVIESVMPRTQQDCNDKMWRSQDRPKLILSLVVASDSKVIFLQSWTTLNIWSRTLIRKNEFLRKLFSKEKMNENDILTATGDELTGYGVAAILIFFIFIALGLGGAYYTQVNFRFWRFLTVQSFPRCR